MPRGRSADGTNTVPTLLRSYMLAQLLPELRERKGFLLVLGSANVDEALRGYYTKYAFHRILIAGRMCYFLYELVNKNNFSSRRILSSIACTCWQI